MSYKSDIEIAQEAKILPIDEIAKKAGIPEQYLEHYGKYKAKVSLDALEELPEKKRQAGSGDGYHTNTGR